MWVNDVERESGGRDVKSVEFAVGPCVATDGAVTKNGGRTVCNICHSAIL